jgi:lipoprotein signal peptidase
MASFLSVNEHPIERLVRVVIGLGLIYMAWSGSLGPWAYIGIIPVITGALGNCPLYTALGISTCPVRK